MYAQSSLLQHTSFVLNSESVQLLNRAKGTILSTISSLHINYVCIMDLDLILGLFQEKHDTLNSLLDELSLLVTNYNTVGERLSMQAGNSNRYSCTLHSR